MTSSPFSRRGAIAVCLPAFLMASACSLAAPPPRAVPAPSTAPAAAPSPGFNERRPDTCGAAALQRLIGQPAGSIRTVKVRGPVRIVAPGGIVAQNEYHPEQIDVYIDGTGRIARIACGG